MIKVEVMNPMMKKSSKNADYYRYIRDWGLKYETLIHHKIEPRRWHIYLYDEKAFEQFKETFKNPWRRVY